MQGTKILEAIERNKNKHISKKTANAILAHIKKARSI